VVGGMAFFGFFVVNVRACVELVLVYYTLARCAFWGAGLDGRLLTSFVTSSSISLCSQRTT